MTDIRMPPTGTDEGIRAAVPLRERHPDIGVVVLSNYAEPASGSEGRAHLLKERVDRAQLVAAIEAVAAGGSVLDPMIVEPLVAAKVRVELSPLAELTAREREVLAEIAKGKAGRHAPAFARMRAPACRSGAHLLRTNTGRSG